KLVQNIYERVSPSAAHNNISSSDTTSSDASDTEKPFTPLLNRLLPHIAPHIPPQVSSLFDFSSATTPLSSLPLWEPAQRIPDQVVLDLSVVLDDVRAAVPIFTSDLSYVNNALIRPIVAYINSRRTMIPIRCRVQKKIGDFDGSWTLYDSGLM